MFRPSGTSKMNGSLKVGRASSSRLRVVRVVQNDMKSDMMKDMMKDMRSDMRPDTQTSLHHMYSRGRRVARARSSSMRRAGGVESTEYVEMQLRAGHTTT